MLHLIRLCAHFKNELANSFVRVQWRNILMNKDQKGFHGLWICEFEALSNRNIQLEGLQWRLKMESGLIEGDNKNN